MKLSFKKITLVLLASLLYSTTAFAEDVDLSLTVAGEAFDGYPHFVVEVDDNIIAEGDVETAIDTSELGRLWRQKNWDPYTQSFTFPVSVEKINGNPITIRMTNDKWGGAGTDLDRGLFLLKVDIGDQEFLPGDMEYLKDGKEAEPNDGYLNLGSNDRRAVILWSDASMASASEAPAPTETAEASTATTEPAEEPEATEAENTAAEASPAEPAAEPAPACTTDTVVNVTGFGNNRDEISSVEQIASLSETLDGQTCTILVEGYASSIGPVEVNMAISGERAEFVFNAMSDAGIDMSKAKFDGKGETRKFGASQAKNRRVVVTIAP